MEYIKSENYDYIIKKYRDIFNKDKIMERFVRNDALFADDSGMAPDDIYAGIRADYAVSS